MENAWSEVVNKGKDHKDRNVVENPWSDVVNKGKDHKDRNVVENAWSEVVNKGKDHKDRNVVENAWSDVVNKGKDHKDRNVVENPWSDVVNCLEFVDNVEQTKTFFINLKKRYQKKKAELRRQDKSGTCLAAVEKARKDLEPYLFLSWLGPFLATRARDVKCTNDKDSSENEEDSSVNEHDEFAEEVHEPPVTSPQPPAKSPAVQKQKQRRVKISKKVSKKQTEEQKDALELDLLMSLQADRKKRDIIRQDDLEQLFANSLAADLRKFSEAEKFMIKHKLHNVVFRYQMARQQTPTQGHVLPQSLVGDNYHQAYQATNNYQLYPNISGSQPSLSFSDAIGSCNVSPKY